VTPSVFPLARCPGAAPRERYFSACFTPLRDQKRMTPMRIDRQDRLGHHDHSLLTTFTSHLEAVSCTPLILIEAPSSAYHVGLRGLGKTTSGEEETSRRFYTKQPQCYCGLDRHARTMVPLPREPGWRDSCPQEYAGWPRTVSQSRGTLPDRSRRLRRMHLHLGLGWPTSVRAKGFLLSSGTRSI
jgi:hypothetical protein